MKTAGWIVLAALTGWLVRGIGSRSDAPAVVRATPPPVIVKSEPIAEPPSVMPRDSGAIVSLGQRNLFAYREQERPVVAVISHTPPPIPILQPAIVEPPAPQPVAFPYRYIGTFGPAHHRVAAFKRDRDIHTVFVGDRLGEFTLRSIGIESVEVEGPDGVRRVPLTDSL